MVNLSEEQQKEFMEFVEWLPQRVKEFEGMNPEQIVDAINGMWQSPEGQKQVQGLMSQFKKEKKSKFAKGGKLAYFICKHAKGGQINDCGCKEDGGKVEKARRGYKVKNDSYEASVKAPGDTTRSKEYNYTTETMKTYPNGAVRYQTKSNNDGYTTTRWDYARTMPTFWQRVGSEGLISALFGNPSPALPIEDIQNWENIIANHPEDPRNALRKENGGVVKGNTGIVVARPKKQYITNIDTNNADTTYIQRDVFPLDTIIRSNVGPVTYHLRSTRGQNGNLNRRASVVDNTTGYIYEDNVPFDRGYKAMWEGLNKDFDSLGEKRDSTFIQNDVPPKRAKGGIIKGQNKPAWMSKLNK